MRHIFFAGALIVSLVMVFSVAMGALNVEIALEAELANNIQEPMAIAIPADAVAAGSPLPDETSNGKFIWGPGAAGADGPNSGKGFAEFIVEIPEANTYAVWGRVIAADGDSDSFWVTWLPADADEDPQLTNNLDFRWSVSRGEPIWHWDRIEAWKADGTHEDREWDLEKGTSKLIIWTREDACMLDCLFITTDLSSEEIAVNLRQPTDEDRTLQIQGPSDDKAVEAADKLSTTWGSIRSQYR